MNTTYKFVYNGPTTSKGEDGRIVYEFKANDMIHWHDVCNTFLVFLSSVYGYEITPKMVMENTKFFGEA